MKTNKNVSSASFIRVLPKQFTLQAVRYLYSVNAIFNKDTYLALIEKDCLDALKTSNFSSYPTQEEILYSSQLTSPGTFDYVYKGLLQDIHSYLIALDKRDNSSLFKHVCKKYNFNSRLVLTYCTNVNIIKFIVNNYNVPSEDINICFLLCCCLDKIDSVRYLITLNVDIQQGIIEAAQYNAYYVLHYFLDNYDTKDDIGSYVIKTSCIQLVISKGYKVPDNNILKSNNYRLAIKYIKSYDENIKIKDAKMAFILRRKGFPNMIDEKLQGWYTLYKI